MPEQFSQDILSFLRLLQMDIGAGGLLGSRYRHQFSIDIPQDRYVRSALVHLQEALLVHPWLPAPKVTLDQLQIITRGTSVSPRMTFVRH